MEAKKQRGAPKKAAADKKKTIPIGFPQKVIDGFGSEKSLKAAVQAWAESYIIHNPQQ